MDCRTLRLKKSNFISALEMGLTTPALYESKLFHTPFGLIVSQPKLFRIVAGSPSRGSVALEEAAAPPVGSLVEVCPSLLPAHLTTYF